MLFSLKKLIPIKIKSFSRLIIYHLFLLRINKYNSGLVVNYMDHYRTLNLKQNIYKKMKINFFGCIFFIPKTLRNAQVIYRVEKEKTEIKLMHQCFSSPTTYIDIGVVHSLENRTNEMLEIIEVQNGIYLGEDDIVRFDDDYGRN